MENKSKKRSVIEVYGSIFSKRIENETNALKTLMDRMLETRLIVKSSQERKMRE